MSGENKFELSRGTQELLDRVKMNVLCGAGQEGKLDRTDEIKNSEELKTYEEVDK